MYFHDYKGCRHGEISRRLWAQGLLATTAALVFNPSAVLAQPSDKIRINLMLDDASSMLHLPVLLAQHLGYFKAEGLQVDVVEQPFAAAAAAPPAAPVLHVWSAPLLQSLYASRVADPWVSVVQTGRTPQLALGGPRKVLAGIKSLKDLEGKKIGVLELGSQAQLCVDYSVLLAGANPKNINYIALGNPLNAASMLRGGSIDLLCAGDPLVTVLEKRGEFEALRNFRSLKETQRVFGGLLPGNSLLVPLSMAAKNPAACQALVNGVVRAAKWLRTAGPSDLLGSMLDSTYLTDRAIYLNAVDNMRESYAIDGVLSSEAFATALRVCNTLDPVLAGERKKNTNPYTNEFVLQAKKRFNV
jgi:NitT/TauT family transport system substrate-binding protein